MRKLLPYEHQLIEALGVTKDEYLNFVAIQRDYKDPKVGTALDVRAADPGTQALVLTIIGTLFQVGAALLAPKPEIPDTGSRRRNRQQRFAPSFGFNSAQDLAKYGDPVNLIYTNNNDNPLGSVRANGSLVWSQIENFGSSQFMQLMVVIGASKLKEIEYNSIAFGQKDLSNFDKGSFFIFGKVNGGPGVPKFANFRALDGTNDIRDTFFPSRLSPDGDNRRPACLIPFHGDKREGFSQAYTPTSSTSLGVFDAVPINVNVFTRDEDGDSEESNILIRLGSVGQDGTWNKDNRDNNGVFEVSNQIELIFTKASGKGSIEDDEAPGNTAIDMRRQMVESLDFSSTYMLGSAKFRFQSYLGNGNRDLEEGDVKVAFECIERGAAPSSLYDRTSPKEEDQELKREIENAIHILSSTPKFKEVDSGTTDPATGNVIFETKQLIPDVGNHALSDEGNFTDPFVVTSQFSPRLNIRYNSTDTITLTPKLNLVDDNGTVIPDSTYPLPRRTLTFDRAGSIEYTKEQKGDLVDDTIIDVSAVKKDIRQAKKSLKALIDDINNGVFDEDIPWGNNGFNVGHYGRDPNENPQSGENKLFNKIDGRTVKAIDRDFRNVRFDSYDKKIMGKNIPYRGNDNDIILFTFIYVDRHRDWHFFSFNGIVNETKEKPFLKDDKLTSRRDRVKNKKKDRKQIQDEIARIEPVKTKIKQKINVGGTNYDLIASNSDTQTQGLLNKDSSLSLGLFERLEDAEEELEARRNKVDQRLKRNFDEMHKQAITVIKDDIDYLESIIEQLPSKDQEDPESKTKVKQKMKALVKEKEADLEEFREIIADWDEYKKSFDNTFFSKCLVKAEKASYETLSEIDTINFSLKVKLFRRVSGRQKKYGEEKVKKFSSSDNGVKSRMVFFRMFYKRQGEDRKPVGIVFAVRRGSESDFYTQIRFKGSDGTSQQPRSKWSFEFEPVYDVSAENEIRPFTQYAFLEDNKEEPQVFDVDGRNGQIKVSWSGRTVAAREAIGYFPDEDERGPIDTNEWDMFSVNSDTNIQFSHESGPEIALTAVTEQQFARQDIIFEKYSNLTMMAVGVYANRGLQDLRSVSALVKKGKVCNTIDVDSKTLSSSDDSTSYAPDIFADTLLDKVNGVGNFIEASNIDLDSLALAKSFCINNNLPKADGTAGGVQMFMDGIIADAGSWREFWINAAPFSLLELARKNGKDTLVPALPVNGSGKASLDNGAPVEVDVSALFTAGNILEGSYKEEFLNYGSNTEDLVASVVYREFRVDETFNRNRTVDVRLKDSGETAVRETFDLSQFVTQREQAIMFAKLLCNQRRHVKKGIEFKTLPSEAGLEPGAFIYVDVGLKTWDQYSSGIVMENGELNAPLNDHQDVGTANFNFLLYQPLTGEVKSKSSVSVTTSSDKTSTASSLSDYKGWMFVMGNEKPNKRVFRVTELEIEGDGELSVKAVEYPCFESGGKICAETADFRSSKFEVS